MSSSSPPNWKLRVKINSPTCKYRLPEGHPLAALHQHPALPPPVQPSPWWNSWRKKQCFPCPDSILINYTVNRWRASAPVEEDCSPLPLPALEVLAQAQHWSQSWTASGWLPNLPQRTPGRVTNFNGELKKYSSAETKESRLSCQQILFRESDKSRWLQKNLAALDFFTSDSNLNNKGILDSFNFACWLQALRDS